jgi:beta-galactosidase
MAHNPPIPSRLDITDALGILALDENHFYGGHYNRGSYTPEDTNDENVDMMDLVRRDRSHASVWMWNACNEVGCSNSSAAKGMRAAVDSNDSTRGMTENHLVDNITVQYLTIQGMSHRAGTHMDSWHAQNPNKPLLSTEAVICPSERGVDSDACPNPVWPPTPGQNCLFNNEVSNCTALQVDYSDSRDFNMGTYVWSGFDYSDVKCAYFGRDLHSRMPLSFTPLLRLKLLQACDQWYSSRVATILTSSHCKLRPNTEGH